MLLLCIRTKKRAASPYPARREPTGSAQAPRPREEGWTCPNCGRICERDGNFCKFCGTERPRLPGVLFCPSCGVQLSPGATFCSECGNPVRAPRMEESTIFRMPGEDGR
jgi:predicted amidophosphoribosyltransferase